LTHLQGIGKLTDAKPVLEQCRKDSHTSGIGESFAKQDDIVHGFIPGYEDMIAQVPASVE